MPRAAIVPMIVACALFMENLDSTVLATALPTIAQALGESPLTLSLAITAYLFSLAVFIPISGWVADRYGGRNVFRAAIVVFLVGSVLCGLSGSLPELVAARLLVQAGTTPAQLAALLQELGRDPQALGRMAEACRALGRPDAAAVIAGRVLELAGASAQAGLSERAGT